MAEEKRRVNAAIDIKLYENVMELGYTISEAITLGLQRLLEPQEEAPGNKAHDNIKEESDSLNSELITSLQNHITSLESQIAVKDDQLRTQAVHLQTVLNQKAIEAPGAKKHWWQFW